MLLEGQVALITGAGRGIGHGIALEFAREGARVAVTGRTKERRDRVTAEIVANGGEAKAFALDVTKDADVSQAVKDVLSTWSQIDILVNNAGVVINSTPVWATTVQQWDDVMAVNLRGVFLCSRAVIPHMKEKGKGFIINIGSSSGTWAGGEDGAYCASKWGLVGYTASLARSLRPLGIRVNGLNPGWVDTDMARELEPQAQPEWSTTKEIARAALFLAAQAPRDMTGQFINIFGT